MKTLKQFLEENVGTGGELIKQPGTRYGSNEGGVYVHSKTSEKYYIKNYRNPDQAKVEVLTGKIYEHMGIPTLRPEMHGESGVVTKWNEDIDTKSRSFYTRPTEQHANELAKMYHAAILTKNWDIAGEEYDNVVHNTRTGSLQAIDHGGAFHFRAQGGSKEYGPDIGEKQSLRDPNNASGHIFNSAFKHYPSAERNGLEAVKKIDDGHIRHLFENSGLSNWKKLHSNFVKRKQALIASYNGDSAT